MVTSLYDASLNGSRWAKTSKSAFASAKMRIALLQGLVEIAKLAVEVPVITVGNIRTRLGAEKILQGGKADLVATGRPIFKDPDFARKMLKD